MSSHETPASAHASSRTGTIQRRCARAATSGTIPPAGACSATCDAMTLARMHDEPSTMAMPVSSHDDSIARTSGPLTGDDSLGTRVLRRAGGWGSVDLGTEAGKPLAHRRVAQRIGRHDQCVLAVVAVVARSEPDRPEAELLVQPPRGQVRQADFKGRLVGAALRREVEQREQQAAPDVL